MNRPTVTVKPGPRDGPRRARALALYRTLSADAWREGLSLWFRDDKAADRLARLECRARRMWNYAMADSDL